MEGEHHYELRSRSRSRSHTPMIFNQTLTDIESVEHHYDLRSKESRERSHTPAEVSSSRRSNSKSLPNSVQKSKEKNMEPIIEKIEENQPETVRESEEQLKENLSISQVPRKAERRSERQRVKRQIFSNEQEEMKDNAISVEEVTEQQQQQQRKSLTPTRTVTSDYSSEEGERDELPSRPGSAYEIYKQAGDWWNVFPKTDYTYSHASQCRYEIAPGVLAMPNMSRPSIHSDSSSVGSSHSFNQRTNEFSQSSLSTREGQTDLINDEMTDTIEQNRVNEENARLFSHSMRRNSNSHLIYKQTHVEKHSHRREIFYGDFSRTQNRFGNFSNIDSDTELDEAISSKKIDQRWRITKWFGKIKSVVTLLFLNIFEFINVKILRRRSVISSQRYHRYQESKWTKAWKKIDHTLQYLYLLLIRVLYLDSWLLSRVTNIRKRFLTGRSKVFWLILLPPLLLAGCWLLPYGYSLIFSRFTGALSQRIKDGTMFGAIYADQPVADVKKETVGKSYEEINGELRQAIERLVNRVNELETAKSNKEKLLANITQAIVELQNDEKNSWGYYEKKLSNLESRLNDNDDESTQIEINNIKLEFNNLQQHLATLKTCCDKNRIQISNSNIEHHVERIMSEYFGSEISKAEIKKIVENLIAANNNVNKDNSAVSECKEGRDESLSSISDAQIQKIMKEILKIYDADKTGRVDYALESAGGQIISIRCTQRYNVDTWAYKILGFTLFYNSGDPRTVIQGHTLQPGVCWAFQDFPGYLLIKLRNRIKVTGFTMEHAPRSILPNNEMKSAPRKFNVWGLKEENDLEPVLFGEYEFLDNDESLQYFLVQNEHITDLYDYVELRIHSNHGQLEYTCLYRFRVHGIPG